MSKEKESPVAVKAALGSSKADEGGIGGIKEEEDGRRDEDLPLPVGEVEGLHKGGEVLSGGNEQEAMKETDPDPAKTAESVEAQGVGGKGAVLAPAVKNSGKKGRGKGKTKGGSAENEDAQVFRMIVCVCGFHAWCA